MNDGAERRRARCWLSFSFLLLLCLLFSIVIALPLEENPVNRPHSDSTIERPGRLAFTLAEPEKQDGLSAALDLPRALEKSSIVKKLIDFLSTYVLKITPETAPVTAKHFERSGDGELSNFEASLSRDAIQSDSPSHVRITDQGFSQVLFGDRGVLTEVFKMLDAKRRNDMTEKQQQQSDSTVKGSGFDFLTVFEKMLMGGQDPQFGDPVPELPEFLGICNRLSCGDIYKAIDQFRKSEFFSNFQTALQLVQDPKGWEVLGQLLSNPELIAQFTGAGAGTAAGAGAAETAGQGLSEMFGSALGGARVEVAKGSDLTREDGDFGTDFSGMANIDEKKENNGPPSLPQTSFSVDENIKGKGAGQDYYAEVVSNIDEDFDTLDIMEGDEDVKATVRNASTTTESSASKKPDPPLPELSFSIDEGPEEIKEGEVVERVVVDVALPKSTIVDGWKMKPTGTTRREGNMMSARSSSLSTHSTARTTSSKVVTYSTRNESSVVDGQVPTRLPSAASTPPLHTRIGSRASRTYSSTPSSFSPGEWHRIPLSSASSSTDRPLTSPSTFSTTPPLTTHPTTRPSTTRRSTKNYRKDNDYYAMYYD